MVRMGATGYGWYAADPGFAHPWRSGPRDPADRKPKEVVPRLPYAVIRPIQVVDPTDPTLPLW